MKKLIHIAFGLALVFGMSSCEDYLDVNTDPDNPVSETVSPQLRLPWIQNYYAYAWGTASMRTNTIAGIMTQTGARLPTASCHHGILPKVHVPLFIRILSGCRCKYRSFDREGRNGRSLSL